MHTSFGPWTTAIHPAGSQLDTFWKRRLAMLPSLSQKAARVTGRALFALLLLAIGALAWPTFQWATHAGADDQPGDFLLSDARSQDQGEPGLAGGTIFLNRGDGKFEIAQGEPDRAGRGDAKPAAPAVEFLPKLSNSEKEFLAALEKPTNVDFNELPLEECLKLLAEEHNLAMYIDRGAISDEGGVGLDTPVTMKFKGLRLDSILRVLTTRLQLAYYFDDDLMTITTATKESETLFTRTYPVRDLFSGRTKPAAAADPDGGDQPARGGLGGGSPPLNGQARRFDAVIEAITATVEPDSWDEVGGQGTIVYVKETGSLVIRQTWSIHRKILQLLRSLRESRHVNSPASGGRQPPEQTGNN